MPRERNKQLAAAIAETGWSQPALAAAVVRVAAESGAKELLGVTRSHIAMWIAGTRPSGRAPQIICEALSRKLQRPVVPSEFWVDLPSTPNDSGWDVDSLTALVALGGQMERRQLMAGAAYSVGGLALPDPHWWDGAPARARSRPASTGRRVGASEITAIREMTAFFSHREQRQGSVDGRTALHQYILDDIAGYLGGTFATEKARQGCFSAAAETLYLAGWMSFDASQHESARRYFTVAIKLAAEAGDGPLAGHVLRAMAHQAADLGHPQQAMELARASVEPRHTAAACSRERALLEVVHARSLAVHGQRRQAAATLLRAEDALAAAEPGDEEPSRVWFFAEASLSHQTAQTLWALGDLKGAEAQFQRSVRTRKADAFSRTHAVTLGFLGQIEAQQGQVEAACAVWSQALDAMQGVQSGRTRDSAATMRRMLSPYRGRGIGAAEEIRERAGEVLGRAA